MKSALDMVAAVESYLAATVYTECRALPSFRQDNNMILIMTLLHGKMFRNSEHAQLTVTFHLMIVLRERDHGCDGNLGGLMKNEWPLECCSDWVCTRTCVLGGNSLTAKLPSVVCHLGLVKSYLKNVLFLIRPLQSGIELT